MRRIEQVSSSCYLFPHKHRCFPSIPVEEGRQTHKIHRFNLYQTSRSNTEDKYPEWCFEWAWVHPLSCTPTCRGNLWEWQAQMFAWLWGETWKWSTLTTQHNIYFCHTCITLYLSVMFQCSLFDSGVSWSICLSGRAALLSPERKAEIGFCLSVTTFIRTLVLLVHKHTHTHTIFSAVNCEVSCLSLSLASLAIRCCLFKWSFSSSSSSTWPWSSVFNSSTSLAFSSKCLKRNQNQDDWEMTNTSLIKKPTPMWVFYLRCELSSLIFLWRLLVISSVFSFEWHEQKIKRRKSKTLICKRASKWYSWGEK